MKRRKQKHHDLVQWQKLHELPCKPASDGHSPYWDFVDNSTMHKNGDLVSESPQANPDCLVDPVSDVHHIPNFINAEDKATQQDIQLAQVGAAMQHLTDRQRLVMRLVSEGYTDEDIAHELDIKQQSVSDIKLAAIKKIKKFVKKDD